MLVIGFNHRHETSNIAFPLSCEIRGVGLCMTRHDNVIHLYDLIVIHHYCVCLQISTISILRISPFVIFLNIDRINWFRLWNFAHLFDASVARAAGQPSVIQTYLE